MSDQKSENRCKLWTESAGRRPLRRYYSRAGRQALALRVMKSLIEIAAQRLQRENLELLIATAAVCKENPSFLACPKILHFRWKNPSLIQTQLSTERMEKNAAGQKTFFI